MTTDTQAPVVFTCDKDSLSDKLALAFRAAATKTAIAVTTGVLLRAASGRIDLSATDGDLTILTSVPAAVETEGEVVLHRIFADIIRSLPPGAVEVIVETDGSVHVSSGRSRFTLRSYPRDQFPEVPSVTTDAVEVPAAELSAAISQTVVAASTDRGRPILMGVLLSADTDPARLVATDSYRLAVRELTGAPFLTEGQPALVPARALAEVAKLLAGEGDEGSAQVRVDERRVSFTIGDTTVVAGQIDGDFPSYQQLLPPSYPNRLEIDKADLLDALRRVALLARDSTPVRVDLESDTIVLRAVDPELGGEAVEEVEGVYTGEPMTIAFNPNYLREGLDVCTTDRVVLETIEPLKPAMLSEPGSRSFLYLLMPVRV